MQELKVLSNPYVIALSIVWWCIIAIYACIGVGISNMKVVGLFGGQNKIALAARAIIEVNGATNVTAGVVVLEMSHTSTCRVICVALRFHWRDITRPHLARLNCHGLYC